MTLQPGFAAADFAKLTGVSHETLDRLTLYGELLTKWQPRINLVSSRSIEEMWWRHFYDSAQLATLIQASGFDDPLCLDMGTGAGFPGLVLAIMGVGRWVLVESDTRKAAFLQEVIRQCGISVTLHADRLESMDDIRVDIVTARAFAPLDRLLGHAKHFMGPDSLGLFMKGRRYRDEVAEAQKNWSFSVSYRQSETDKDGYILLIQRVK